MVLCLPFKSCADQPLKPSMAAKRRPSVRTRMKVEDVSSWVNQASQGAHGDQALDGQVIPPTYQPLEQPPRVRFNVPAPPEDDDDLETVSVNSIPVRPVPLDGGYGWVVTFYSFVMHMILDGSSFCFGILYVAIQRDFGVSRVASSLTASFFLSLPLLLAVVAGLSSDIWGCRFSILFGSSICIVSCIASMFCQNVWLFTSFFGFGCGVGMSFIYNAAITVVTYYFEKKRGVATSIAVSGTGVGTLVYPFYLDFIVTYGKDYIPDLQTMLLAYTLGYIIIFIVGWFIEDCEWTSDTQPYKLRKFEKKLKALQEEHETIATQKGVLLRHAISLPNLNIAGIDPGSIRSVTDVATDKKSEMPPRSKSVALFENQHPTMPAIPEYTMLNTGLANLEHLDLELANSPCHTVKATRKRVTSKISMSVDQINELDDEDFKVNILSSTETTTETDDESSSDDSEVSNDGDSSSSEISEKRTDPTAKLLSPIAPTFTRSSSSAPNSARVNRQSLVPGPTNMFGGRIMASNAYQGRFASNLLAMGKIPSAPMLIGRKKKRSFLANENFTDFLQRLREEQSLIPVVLENRAFKWIVISVFFLYLVLDVPYVCFYDFALDQLNTTETEANRIYNFIGGTNIIFTLIYGKLADLKQVRDYISFPYAFLMLLTGVSMGIATLINGVWSLIGTSVLFGASVTANYALQSIIVTICFEDVNVFQPAYSIVTMIEGVASFIGPMMFGPMRDYFGNFKAVFIIGCVSCLISGAAMIKFHFAHNKLKAEREREEELRQERIQNRISRRTAENEKGRNNGTNEIEHLLLA